MKFTKKDLISSIITGFTTGFIAWRVLVFLEIYIYPFGAALYHPIHGCPYIDPCPTYITWGWLIIIVPILWIIGVNLGYFLGRWMPFFNQFGKYAAIGFTNAAVDFGVLNLLIAYFGIASGLLFSVFKTLSFVVAVTHSYYWNKRWAFEGSSSQGGEFFKFITVNIVVALINVGTASFIVNGIDPWFGADNSFGNLGAADNTWANFGAVVGSAVALAFNFIAFKLIVFKKKDNAV